MLPVADWVVIATHLTLTVAVGVFIAVRWRKQSAAEMMVAGRSMNAFSVALSLISGLTSGISYVGIPGYAIENGVGIMFTFLAYIIVAPVGAFLIIPFFHHLNLVTAYSYFSRRFNASIRTIAAVLFVLRVSLYLGVVLYIPSLLIYTAIGIPVYASILFTAVLSTLWTLKGGMYAVVYTDALQSIAMIVGLIVCISFAVAKLDGGLTGMFNTLQHPGHNESAWLQFSRLITPDPTAEHSTGDSFWAVGIGLGITSLAQCATDQLCVQRFMTTKSLSECRQSFLGMCLMNAVMSVVMGLEGVIILGFYVQRDGITPLQAGNITKSDQILPYFATNELPHGVAGLLIAAVVGSTMSVYSAGLNSAATCVHVDIITFAFKRKASEKAATIRLYVLTAVFGVLTILIALLASLLHGKGVVVLSNMILGVCAGPLLGICLLGMLTERVNSTGALVGVITGASAMVYYGVAHLLCPPGSDAPLAVCSSSVPVFNWYFTRINSWWSGLVATTITSVVAGLCSLCTKRQPRESLQGLTVWTVDFSKGDESPLERPLLQPPGEDDKDSP